MVSAGSGAIVSQIRIRFRGEPAQHLDELNSFVAINPIDGAKGAGRR
jgi:hypothetical protein